MVDIDRVLLFLQYKLDDSGLVDEYNLGLTETTEDDKYTWYITTNKRPFFEVRHDSSRSRFEIINHDLDSEPYWIVKLVLYAITTALEKQGYDVNIEYTAGKEEPEFAIYYS